MAIVSIAFRHRDFHFKIAWLGPKRKLNGNRMYMLLPPMHYSRISRLLQDSEFVSCFCTKMQENPTIFLNFSFKQA